MTSLEPLQIVPAGAGSGKTHTIQEQLTSWIVGGVVEPDRIIAVTYTEAAAAELRQRIRAGLLEKGKIEDALRLSQAYISTIHGLGLRLLTEFAFQAGMSPAPRLLNDDEQNALIRTALARTEKADEIAANLAAYGYSYSAGTHKTGEEVFRDTLLKAVELLRSTGGASSFEVSRHIEAATRRIAERYGGTKGDDGLHLTLRDEVRALLREFPHCLDTQYGSSKTAIEQYRNDFHFLGQASREGELDSDWSLWQRLRGLRMTRSDSLPYRYLVLASEIREAADGLVEHSGPLRHAQSHLSSLLQAGQEALAHYSESKQRAGLVDYTDMIADAERLLRERPDVLRILADRVDCLVVDEFQDTNPLQFAMLWRIKEAGVPTLVVGDLKQAIMGFQGADPRLFEALERGNRDVSRPLKRNWRSQPQVMEFVNTVGPALFGGSYVALRAQREPSPAAALEIINFRKNPRSQRHAVKAFWLGRRLKRLLNDPSQMVVDRQTKTARRLRGSDIAVLCHTNTTLSEYARVLRALGLRVNHQADGWLRSRPVQLAWHALSYLANPADRHAALYLAVTELGSLGLQDGIQQLMDKGGIDDPVLRNLDALSERVADRTVYALVADTLSALGLFDTVALWPHGEQARANLVRLLGEAAEFMDANREALAHGDFHGYGVETFLAWLAERETEEDEQPEKNVLDEDAIALRSWHRAKGLEWPVVAVCNLDRQVKERLPDLALEYSSFDDLSRILENARIDYWPSYAAPEQNREQLSLLQQRVVTESKRLLYVALTRARDKLVLEWPGFLAQRRSTTESYWSLLGGRWSLHEETRQLEVNGRMFPCEIADGGAELPEDFDPHSEPEKPGLPVVGRRAIRPGIAPTKLTPESVAASTLTTPEETVPASQLVHAQYHAGLDADIGLFGADLGTFLHRCFEILGSRPDLESQLTQLTGVEVNSNTQARIATAVARFEAWLRDRFEVESVMREWPLLVLHPKGSVLSGTADLIVQTGDGAWVLDHKSDQSEDPAATFHKYQPQLNAYARALSEEGKSVIGIGINLIRRGEVVMERYE